ncbi:MAG: VOC family protein [Nocardioidaceae bacterium]
MAAGDLGVCTVVVNVTDMDRAVAFWTEALGYRVREPEVDPEFTVLVDPEGRKLPVSLQIADKIPDDPAPVHRRQ